MPPSLPVLPERPLPDSDAVARVLADRFPRGAIARVLLVKPPDADVSLFNVETARRGRYQNYPAYGLAVLAAHLRSIGVDVRILNLNHDVLVHADACPDPAAFDFDATWKSLLDAAIEAFDPDLVGVTCMFTMTHASLRAVCAHAALAGRPVAIGGVHASNDVERVLDDIPSATFAFLKEADATLPLFCRVVGGELGVDALRQVIVRDDGTRHRFLAEHRPTVDELDVMPAYDLVENVELARVGMIGILNVFTPRGTPTGTVLSNRGCRAHCTFCSVPSFNGRSVRQRPVESVLDELERLRDLGVRHVVWLDDDLLKDRERALALFRGMTARRLGLTWDASNGLIAASCDRETVEAMRDSGCVAVHLGMESGNPTILRRIRKPGTVEVFLRAAEVFREFPEIHVRVFLMIGFPEETLGMIEDTVDVGLRMDLDWYAISPLQALPNTPIFDAMVEQGTVQPVDRILTFMGGGYGQQDRIDATGGSGLEEFRRTFRSLDREAVPTPDQLHDIWFQMNYQLNFHRLYHEARPVKIANALTQLGSLADRISPDHALALYFIGYLQVKTRGAADPTIVDRLRRKLATSGYWRARFDAFGMSGDDVARGVFPNERAGSASFGVRPAAVGAHGAVPG